MQSLSIFKVLDSLAEFAQELLQKEVANKTAPLLSYSIPNPRTEPTNMLVTLNFSNRGMGRELQCIFCNGAQAQQSMLAASRSFRNWSTWVSVGNLRGF